MTVNSNKNVFETILVLLIRHTPEVYNFIARLRFVNVKLKLFIISLINIKRVNHKKDFFTFEIRASLQHVGERCKKSP